MPYNFLKTHEFHMQIEYVNLGDISRLQKIFEQKKLTRF